MDLNSVLHAAVPIMEKPQLLPSKVNMAPLGRFYNAIPPHTPHTLDFNSIFPLHHKCITLCELYSVVTQFIQAKAAVGNSTQLPELPVGPLQAYLSPE